VIPFQESQRIHFSLPRFFLAKSRKAGASGKAEDNLSAGAALWFARISLLSVKRKQNDEAVRFRPTILSPRCRAGSFEKI